MKNLTEAGAEMKMNYKLKHEINESDVVAGVVYAAAAEQRIAGAFVAAYGHEDQVHPPTAIGYVVKVDDAGIKAK